MQIILKKGSLNQINLFIKDMKLSGAKANRGRFRFLKLLSSKLTEIDEERVEIAKNYANLEKDGSPKIVDNHFDLDKNKQIPFLKAQNELYAENSRITIDDYTEQLKPFAEALENYDETIDGDSIFAFGVLCDAFEPLITNKNDSQDIGYDKETKSEVVNAKN